MRVPALALVLTLVPTQAFAQFAQPPEGEVVVPRPLDASNEPWPPEVPNSIARIHIGPALDLAHGEPGFHAALDVGRSAGFRAATSFVSLGSDGGMALYSGELWLCPLEFGILRPIAAAGAGFRNVRRDDDGTTHHERAGVAVLRGGLEVLLPTHDIESRAAVSVAGYLPAIVSHGADPESSYLLTGSLALGF